MTSTTLDAFEMLAAAAMLAAKNEAYFKTVELAVVNDGTVTDLVDDGNVETMFAVVTSLVVPLDVRTVVYGFAVVVAAIVFTVVLAFVAPTFVVGLTVAVTDDDLFVTDCNVVISDCPAVVPFIVVDAATVAVVSCNTATSYEFVQTIRTRCDVGTAAAVVGTAVVGVAREVIATVVRCAVVTAPAPVVVGLTLVITDDVWTLAVEGLTVVGFTVDAVVATDAALVDAFVDLTVDATAIDDGNIVATLVLIVVAVAGVAVGVVLTVDEGNGNMDLAVGVEDFVVPAAVVLDVVVEAVVVVGEVCAVVLFVERTVEIFVDVVGRLKVTLVKGEFNSEEGGKVCICV
jgi:hypothetical protein